MTGESDDVLQAPSAPDVSTVASVSDLWQRPNVDPRVRELFYPHSLRVMALASRLGKRLEIDPDPLEVAGIAHDIGKAGLYSGILLKPDSLTPLEWAFVQSHCHAGNWVCREVLERPKAGEYVRDHHERWDGQGYPRGLEEDEISVGGRLLAVADVFDTLAFESRPYQDDSWTVEEALEELRACAGTQFDPDAVEEFTVMLDDEPWMRSEKKLLQEANQLLSS